MIWLTWRQFRWQAVTAAAVLTVLAIALGATGPGLVARFDQAGLTTCHLTCGTLSNNFIEALKSSPYDVLFYAGVVLMYLAPALIGIFWGAPLIARELETGTHRLAWNQSVSRTRWTVAKLALIGLAAIATAGLLSLMISWWASPIDHALSLGGGPTSPVSITRLSPALFAARGVAPLGYAAFAFALGVTAGVLIRRTLPAMALTLAIFAAAQLLVPNFVRPNLISPVRVTAPFNANAADEISVTVGGGNNNTMTVMGNFTQPGAWVLSNKTITPAGKVFTGPATAACAGNSTPQQCTNWLNGLHLRQLVTYQPANRFWPLQGIETGLYVIFAAGLAWLCAWQIRRRRA